MFSISYLTRLIKYIAANIPVIANKNSKPDIGVGIGEIAREGEGIRAGVGVKVGKGEGVKAIYSKGLPIQSLGLNSLG